MDDFQKALDFITNRINKNAITCYNLIHELAYDKMQLHIIYNEKRYNHFWSDKELDELETTFNEQMAILQGMSDRVAETIIRKNIIKDVTGFYNSILDLKEIRYIEYGFVE